MVGCFVGIGCRKLRITFQPVMQKARVVEPKTQRCFVDNRETMWGKSVLVDVAPTVC